MWLLAFGMSVYSLASVTVGFVTSNSNELRVLLWPSSSTFIVSVICVLFSAIVWSGADKVSFRVHYIYSSAFHHSRSSSILIPLNSLH